MGVPAEYFEDNMIVIRERFRQESDLRSHIYSKLKDMSAVERTVALEELRGTLSLHRHHGSRGLGKMGNVPSDSYHRKL